MDIYTDENHEIADSDSPHVEKSVEPIDPSDGRRKLMQAVESLDLSKIYEKDDD